MKLKAENGLIYQRDGDGWTVVASCITGARSNGKSLDAELAQRLVKAVEACRVARDAINGPQYPGYLNEDELHALELIEEVLGD